MQTEYHCGTAWLVDGTKIPNITVDRIGCEWHPLSGKNSALISEVVLVKLFL